MRKKIIILLVLAGIFYLGKLSLSRENDFTEVIFCDVGQGDATLVQRGTFQLLIDAGPDESVMKCLQNHLPVGDRTLDFVLISHPHADHYQGMKAVLEKYRVANVMIPDVPQLDKDYLAFRTTLLSLVESGRTQVVSPEVNWQWRFFYDLGFQVVYALPNCSPEDFWQNSYEIEKLSDMITKCAQNEKNINNYSIGIILNIEDILLTFTGDLEKERELALVNSGLLMKTDVLKVPHHGSKTSSTSKFLDVLKPNISVISVAAKNSYGHPTKEVLERLEGTETTIYRTDVDGEIYFQVQNNTLNKINQQAGGIFIW